MPISTSLTSIAATLGLGFLLGLKHALDADHVAAVSTITSQTKSIRRATFVGVLWGLGHTTTLLIVGVFVLAFELTIPARVGLGFEFLVGIMLVALGVRVLHRIRKEKIHVHRHAHDGTPHIHLHSHAETPSHSHHHMPFIIGIVHGLAGSAALMLLVLATIHSLPLGIFYILIFGFGTVIGMAVITTLISLPFLTINRIASMHTWLTLTAGIVSVLLGFATMYEIGIVQKLFL